MSLEEVLHNFVKANNNCLFPKDVLQILEKDKEVNPEGILAQ